MSKALSGPELIKLRNQVVDDFTESDWKELGALTDMLDEVEEHPRLLRSLSWQDPDYEGLALTFLKKMIGQEGENLSIVQNYIYGKCSNAGEDISSEAKEGRKIVFSPAIFDIPEGIPDKNLISVMMPFNPGFASVYEHIKTASNMAGFDCLRADDIWQHSTVIQDIFSLIFRSFIVVCDFTGKNPNVFYEAGIAHTLGKHVVPITQSEHDIPFDLQHHRYIKYLNNGEGLKKLSADLGSRLATLASKNRSGWL